MLGLLITVGQPVSSFVQGKYIRTTEKRKKRKQSESAHHLPCVISTKYFRTDSGRGITSVCIDTNYNMDGKKEQDGRLTTYTNCSQVCEC